MTLPAGYDFRATSGYVTDAAGNTYEIATTANYPTSDALGNTSGWEQAPSGTRDRDNSVNPKLAGIAFNNASVGTLKTWRIDLPSTGTYNVRCACGDATSSNNAYLDIFDNVTLVAHLVTSHLAMGVGTFYDATDVLRSSASDWVTNNALSGPFTFSSTICRIKIDGAISGACALAHFYIESAGGGATRPVKMAGAWGGYAGESGGFAG